MGQGVPPENFYFISSKLKLANGISRIKSLEPKDFETYFGKIVKNSYDLKTDFMTLSDPKIYLHPHGMDSDQDRHLSGLYHDAYIVESESKLDTCAPFQVDTEQSKLDTQNIVSSLSLCTVMRQQNSILAPCCSSSVSTKSVKIVSSECHKLLWKRFDK